MLKNEIGAMVLSVAEKILKQDLQSNAEQQKLADTFVKDLHSTTNTINKSICLLTDIDSICKITLDLAIEQTAYREYL